LNWCKSLKITEVEKLANCHFLQHFDYTVA
jgi:hypothetical protein